MNGLNIDLTAIMQAVIALIATLITTKLLPWLKEKTTQEQQKTLFAITKTLVFAAEQLFAKKEGEDVSQQKLLYVQEKLQERGFSIDIDAIEAAVMELRIEKKSGTKVSESTGEKKKGETDEEVEEPPVVPANPVQAEG